MRLRKESVRPAWKPIYADRMNRVNRVKSWSNFIGEAYWIVELEKPMDSVRITAFLLKQVNQP